MELVHWIHVHLGWWVVALNAVAGVACLVVWRVTRWRGRGPWILSGVAEIALLVQILLGVIMVSSGDYQNDQRIPFHMFYGFVSFVVIGLLFAYRRNLEGRLELAYGLGGCFLAGLAIRAIMQVL